MAVKIKNKQARKLWLFGQGLGNAANPPLDVMAIIKMLGFVQLDTIQVVSRAHHHILWSRNPSYREPMLEYFLSQSRELFEHFTHDASLIPMEFYPMWQRQFARKKAFLDKSKWFSSMLDKKGRNAIKQRISLEGPLSTHAFESAKNSKKMWARPPHKLALDYMWYSGELATAYRENFNKFYDLGENIFPPLAAKNKLKDEAQIDWLCNAALNRLKFATLGEIQKFWDATTAQEVKAWAERNKDNLQNIEIETADGTWVKTIARPDIEQHLNGLGNFTTKLQILNPFDPAIRDRKRLQRLFGFEYRNEMFVPEAKRKWGYYVFPILEKDQFIGRIELKADRKSSVLNVKKIWHEDHINWTKSRSNKLDAELARLSKLANVDKVHWD